MPVIPGILHRNKGLRLTVGLKELSKLLLLSFNLFFIGLEKELAAAAFLKDRTGTLLRLYPFPARTCAPAFSCLSVLIPGSVLPSACAPIPGSVLLSACAPIPGSALGSSGILTLHIFLPVHCTS